MPTQREKRATSGGSSDAEAAILGLPQSGVVEGAPRRVRFVGCVTRQPRVGEFLAAVELEWSGETYRGEAEGESGSAAELRTAALAACRALEAVLPGSLRLSVVGVKAIRVFDNDMVATLLHSPENPDRRLVGVALVTEDPYTSASRAVLNATNRLLGNYLVTAD